MDLMMLIPNLPYVPHLTHTPVILHKCEVPPEEDELNKIITSNSCTARVHRWFLRKRIVSRKHAFTRWTLKSSMAISYEIKRHLRTFPYMIHPFSSFRIYWEISVMIFTLITLLVLPVLLAFYFYEGEQWYMFSVTADCIFICDIAIWFFTGYYDDQTKLIVLDPIIVARTYLKEFFILDVLPAIPLEIIPIIYKRLYTSPWICVKMLRMRVMLSYARRLRYVYKISFVQYKLLKMSTIIIVIIHWAACLEFYVPLLAQYFHAKNEESWIHSKLMQQRDTKIKQYILCLHRAMTSLTHSAQYLAVSTTEDITLGLILNAVGAVGFIYMLAQLVQIMTTYHSTEKKNLKLTQELQDYMHYKELPLSLQRRLMTYYDYRFKKGFDRNKAIIDQVSPYLREELVLHNYLRMFKNVEMFQYMPKTIIVQLTAVLQSKIYLMGDVIVKAGTPGDRLYFVGSGTVAVYTSLGTEVCHLEDGAHFGEIALVVDNELRIATVVAIETCELYVLHRSDFKKVLLAYPNLFQYFRDVALQRLEQTLVLDEAYEREGLSVTNINISNIRGTRRIEKVD